MVEVGEDVRGLLAQAQRAAQKRGETSSTAHLLLAMVQSRDESGQLLWKHGVRDVTLLGVIGQVEAEANNAVDLALQRASQLAVQSGSTSARPLHLLLATLRDARTAATRCLTAIRVPSAGLCQVLEDSLGLPSKPRPDGLRRRRRGAEHAAPVMDRPLPRAEPERVLPVEPGRLLPRTSLEWEQQKRVEAKAKRDRSEEPLAPTESTVREVAPHPELPEPEKKTDASLDRARFSMLATLGRNLSEAAARDEIDPVIGREDEIDKLLDILARRRANNPILVGPAGVGKTALVEGLALRLQQERVEGFSDKIIIEVSAGALVSGTGVRGALAERITRLRAEVKASEGRVLLFLDEIHALVAGTDGGPDDLANELKAALARGELPCIGATTDAEYRRVFEKDSALARRFSRVEVEEPSREATLGILKGIATHYEVFHGVAYESDALQAAVDMSVRYLTESHLPDKAVGLIDLAAARTRRRGGQVVDRASVAEVVSEQANVPVERLLQRDGERLLNLEEHLSRRVIGQHDAIRRISESIRKGAVGLRGKKPLGVFLLLGPTGVGKTELAKALSEQLFSGNPMTRLDMSEYSESHAVARLFGAPPGYVGHEEGGQLTEAVRRRPYQLILLDEVEKAHPDALLTLLPLLDEGRLTDGRGRTADFTNAVVVMTSNLGAQTSSRSGRIGFAGEGDRRANEGQSAVAAVKRALPPELFNRLDEVIYCPRLSRDAVRDIARGMLKQMALTLEQEQGLKLELDDSVLDALIEAGGYDEAYGARPMRRTLAREVESPLASAILAGRLEAGDTVRLVGDGPKVRFARRVTHDDGLAAGA